MALPWRRLLVQGQAWELVRSEGRQGVCLQSWPGKSISIYVSMHPRMQVCMFVYMYASVITSIIYHLFICHLSSFYLYPSVLAMQEAAHWPNGFLPVTMRARLSEYAASWMPEKVGRTCVLDDTCSLWGLPPCSGLLLPLAVHFLTVWASLG